MSDLDSVLVRNLQQATALATSIQTPTVDSLITQLYSELVLNKRQDKQTSTASTQTPVSKDACTQTEPELPQTEAKSTDVVTQTELPIPGYYKVGLNTVDKDLLPIVPIPFVVGENYYYQTQIIELTQQINYIWEKYGPSLEKPDIVRTLHIINGLISSKAYASVIDPQVQASLPPNYEQFL